MQGYDVGFTHKDFFQMPPRIRKELGDHRRERQRQQPRADEGHDPKTRERGQCDDQNSKCHEFN